MVSEVIDDQVVVVDQERPEGVIEVDGEAVAMADHQPGSVRVAVTAEDDYFATLQRHPANRPWLGYVPNGVLISSQIFCQASTLTRYT